MGTKEPVPTFGEAGGGEAVEEFARVDTYSGERLAEAIGGVESDSQVSRLSGCWRKIRRRRRYIGVITGVDGRGIAVFFQLAVERGASDAEEMRGGGAVAVSVRQGLLDGAALHFL